MYIYFVTRAAAVEYLWRVLDY